jgi:hypothetical protein
VQTGESQPTFRNKISHTPSVLTNKLFEQEGRVWQVLSWVSGLLIQPEDGDGTFLETLLKFYQSRPQHVTEMLWRPSPLEPKPLPRRGQLINLFL